MWSQMFKYLATGVPNDTAMIQWNIGLEEAAQMKQWYNETSTKRPHTGLKCEVVAHEG